MGGPPLTFAKGASLKDPSKLFNSSLEGNMRRAIDFSEGAKINEKAFKALIREAVELNKSKAKPKPKATAKPAAKKAPAKKAPAKKAPAKAKAKAKS